MKIRITLMLIALLGFVQRFQAQNPNDNTVYKWFQVQEKATFPGGETALDEYIKSNISIPEIAYDSAENGTVVVKFIVEKNGSLSKLEIASMRKIGFGVEKATLKLFKGLPKWEPAIVNDAPCRMEFQKPVRYTFR